MTVTLEASRARCNEYYAANRDQIQAARKAKRLRARAEEFEQAVLLGRPIGHTIPVCGSALARVWHRTRREVCGQCAYAAALDLVARTWVPPRTEPVVNQPSARSRAYYEANKERIQARNKAWAAANREKMREYGRRYARKPEVRARKAAQVAADPERESAYKRAHYQRVGREAWNERGAAWRAANRERDRARHQARKRAEPDRGANDTALRRARVRALPAESVDRQSVWLRDGGICHLCSLPADAASWHLDHVVPIARGGPHTYDNVRVSHPACNQRKGARVPSQS